MIRSEVEMGHSFFGAAEVGSARLMQALVVEDSAVYRKLIGDHLRSWGFGVTLAVSGSEAWQILEKPDSPKLVLLDWVLPDLDGIELCKRIRQAGSSGPYVYVILLTSNEGQQNMLDAMQAGADDYLVKPFDALELRARLLVGKQILVMLERELERSRRERAPLAVILGDIDHFKSVNDTFGHLFGDEALREIGRRLRAQIRVYDGVGRYGGEEFLMVLPNCDLPNAQLRANELREIIASTPVVCSGEERLITMSMGIAVSVCEGKNEVERLLNQADAGLYAAKEKGRNRIEHFTAAPKKKATARGRKS